MGTPSWLVSYPRSGTTWMRFLLAHLLDTPAVTSAALARRVPSIHEPNEHWAERLSADGWLCTHRTFGAQAERYGTAMERIVHLVRHPADAQLSAARYHCLTQASTILRTEGHVDAERLEEALRTYLELVLQEGRTPQHDRAGMGTWGEHAASWVAQHEAYPTLLVRYEDLVRDAPSQVRRLAGFLGMNDVDADAVAQRYRKERLRELQELEIGDRIRGPFYLGDEHQVAYDLGLRFVGRGRVGEGLQLGATARARLDALFGPCMAAFGYTTDPHAPVLYLPGAPEVVPG